MQKHLIQVRKYGEGQTSYGSDSIGKITGNFGRFEVVETIKRKLRARQVGNFNPIFCTYKGYEMLVNSDEGDLSDPFRRDESYAKSFFIEVNHCPSCGKLKQSGNSCPHGCVPQNS